MIHPISSVKLRLVSGSWPIGPEMVQPIAEHWARLTADNPHLWNGRVLGTVAPGRPGGLELVGDVLTGTAIEGDFASFLAWRDWGFPDFGIRNLFGSALIQSSDGALIFGEMGPHTANAGQIYAPGGSLEPEDADKDGWIDVVGSIEREMAEETGLDHRAAEVAGTYVQYDGPRVSVGRVYRFDRPAVALVAEIHENLDGQHHRELARVVAVHSAAEAGELGVKSYSRIFAEYLLPAT